MKIRVAVLDKDKTYLSRFVTAFEARYSERMSLLSFTDAGAALQTVSSQKIDVLLVSEDCEFDISALPKKCGFAYLSESSGVDFINGKRAIFKFQKAENIFKQIIGVYSDVAVGVSGNSLDFTPVILFAPVSGGTGASSMAAAFAKRKALAGKRALYLSFEKFGSSEAFFKTDSPLGMSEVIYALLTGASNLRLKLESSLSKSEDGVFFLAPAKIALDMQELTPDNMITLIQEARNSGLFDFIAVDSDFSLDKGMISVYENADVIVWTSDGSELSNAKLFRTYSALEVLEKKNGYDVLGKLKLVYNKYSNKTSKSLSNIEIANVGGAPKYEHASATEVVSNLARLDFLDKIVG